MNSNHTPTGEPVINNNAIEALRSFIPEVFMSRLIFGTFKVLLYYLKHEQDREDFLEDYLNDVERLIEFLEALRVEYELSRWLDDDALKSMKEAISQCEAEITDLKEANKSLTEKHTELVSRYTDLVLQSTKR